MSHIKLLILIGCALLIAASVGCRNESPTGPIDDGQPGYHLLQGTWKLDQYCDFAWGHGCISADSMGVEQYFIFTPNEHCRQIWDGVESPWQRFRIVRKEDIRFNRIVDMIEIDGQTDMAFGFRGTDTLLLDIVAFDAPSWRYVRVPDIR